jgi:hypothetical protein
MYQARKQRTYSSYRPYDSERAKNVLNDILKKLYLIVVFPCMLMNTQSRFQLNALVSLLKYKITVLHFNSEISGLSWKLDCVNYTWLTTWVIPSFTRYTQCISFHHSCRHLPSYVSIYSSFILLYNLFSPLTRVFTQKGEMWSHEYCGSIPRYSKCRLPYS